MASKKYRYFDEDPKRFCCASGSPEKIDYSPVIKDDGSWELKESGKTNVFDEIQSHRDSVDIHVLMARYEAGEVDALNRRQGFYADISGMPKTPAEWFQRVQDGKDAFMALPAEIRAKFGHNFENWMINMGSEDWFAKMSGPDSNVESVGADSNVGNNDGEVKAE